MKVLLVFPPLWVPHRPYLSLPSLFAYLKNNGIDVIQRDFNIEAYNLLLSESYLKYVGNRLKNNFNTLESKSRLDYGIEQEYYCDLYKAISNLEYISERIEDAKNTFRDKNRYYDVSALVNARNIIRQAQSIISIGCFPSGQDLVWPLLMRFQRSVDDIHKITQNNIENPFITLYQNHLIPFILKEKPDIVGISIPGETQLIPALTLSRLIKSSCKDVHVVMGGYVISMLYDTLMKYKDLYTNFFDSVIINEGERPLLKLVENLNKGRSLQDVPNLIYLEEGKIRANEVLPPEDINALPTPCFDGLPFELYLNPELVLPILSSKGCYWGKCAFCSHNTTSYYHYKVRDSNKVVDDIQELSQQYNVKHFTFTDEAITPASMSKLSDEIIKRKMNIRCSTNLCLDPNFTASLCNKMYKAGFRLLYLGLESGCNRVLNYMEKGVNKDIATKVCKNIYDAHIWNHVYTFLGFPTETKEEAQETIDFLLYNKHVIRSFNINNFILTKGSKIMKNPEQYGLTSIDTGYHVDFTLEYNYTLNSGITFDEALKMSNVYREKIANEYSNKEVLKLDYEDIILYLSHFENKDPFLLSLIKKNDFEPQNICKLTWESVPRIKQGVSLNYIRYNVLDIISNLDNKKGLSFFPNPTYLIFNPFSGDILPTSQLIIDVFNSCNGNNNIHQISYNLSKKYDATVSQIEEGCLSLLKSLEREGVVVFDGYN